MLSGPLFRKTFKSQLRILVIFAAILAMYMGVEISMFNPDSMDGIKAVSYTHLYGPHSALYPPGVTVRNRRRLLSWISGCHSEASSDTFPNCFASTSSFLDVPGILLFLINVL